MGKLGLKVRMYLWVRFPINCLYLDMCQDANCHSGNSIDSFKWSHEKVSGIPTKEVKQKG